MADATVNIPKDVLQPIIEARVNAALAEVFSDKGHLLDQMMKRVLAMKVDSNGRPSDSAYGTTPMLDFEIQRAVQNAIRSTVEKACESHGDQLRDALVAQLQRKNSPLLRSLAESMISGLSSAAKSKYLLRIEYKGND